MAGISILFLGDQQELMDHFGERLCKAGHLVEYSLSAPELSQQWWKDSDVDVVLLTVATPEPDGLVMLSSIKTRNPLVEVILITPAATVRSAVQAIKLGAFDYLPASCTWETLLGRVGQAAMRKREREEKIFNIRIQPYVTELKRKELLKQVFED